MLTIALLTATLVAALAFWWVYRTDRKRGIPYPQLTALLRALLFFGIVLMLWAPQITKRNSELLKPTVVIVQDNSLSVQKALGKDSLSYQKKLAELRQQLSKDFKVVNWDINGPIAPDSPTKFDLPYSNLSEPLESISELYGFQNLGAIILASDGWYNQGNNPLFSSLPMNTTLYGIALGDTTIVQDIKIGKVYANRTSNINNEWQIRVEVIAQKCYQQSTKLQILDAQGTVLNNAPINIDKDRFDASYSFSILTDKRGLQQYRLRIPKIDNETNTSNNEQILYVEVIEEKKKILLLAAAPHPDINAITQALAGFKQYELERKNLNELARLQAKDYAAIIAHQLPAQSASVLDNLLSNSNVWYIVGSQSNYNTLNQLQSAVKFNPGYLPRQITAELNTSFGLFSLPSNTAAVIDRWPPLNTSAADWNSLTAGENLLVSADNKALWTLQKGTKATAVLCGEGLWQWRMHEYKNTKEHKIIDECIRQTINFLSANHNNKKFRVELPKTIWSNSEQVQFSAFLYNANNELINTSEANLKIKDSNGNIQNFNFEKNGNAYRLNIGALAPGPYSFVASSTFNGQNYSDEGRLVVNSQSIELMEEGCNYSLMQLLAKNNKGTTVHPNQMQSLADSIQKNQQIKSVLNEQIETVALIDWRWIFFVLLLIATAEWLLRKYWMAM